MRRLLRMVWVIGSYLLTMGAALFSNILKTLPSKLAVLFVGLVCSFGLFYNKHYRPMVAVERDKLENFCEFFLYPRLRQAYKLRLREVHERNSTSGRSGAEARARTVLDGLRINVMLFRRRDLRPWDSDGTARLLPWQRSLQIDFSTDNYSDGEKDLKWRPNVGCCGHALSEREAIAGDLCQDHHHRDRWNVPATHQEIAATDLGSVLSIPIYRQRRGEDSPRGQLVGVLNIDSKHCLAVSQFDEEYVSEPLVKYARFLGVFL